MGRRAYLPPLPKKGGNDFFTKLLLVVVLFFIVLRVVVTFFLCRALFQLLRAKKNSFEGYLKGNSASVIVELGEGTAYMKILK